MTTSPPPQVEIRRELDRFVLRSVQPMGLRVLSVDDAVAVAAARELVSRQEIDRLRAENARFRAEITEHVRVRTEIGDILTDAIGGYEDGTDSGGVMIVRDVGLLAARLAEVERDAARISPGVSETPEATE